MAEEVDVSLGGLMRWEMLCVADMRLLDGINCSAGAPSLRVILTSTSC